MHLAKPPPNQICYDPIAGEQFGTEDPCLQASPPHQCKSVQGSSLTDIPTLAFLRLRQRFFDNDGSPVRFHLRDKRNTQDDPFDEFLTNHVLVGLENVSCISAPGPLITPDLVLHRSSGRIDRADDLAQVVGIEVKKLERTESGVVARASGLDYNTTPPCGRIRVYDAAATPLVIRGFYLFVCLEHVPRTDNQAILSALALVDGNVLNEDFSLYLSITGERTKRIDLGTFFDGADRNRPMLIFSNPLGIPELDRAATLIHTDRALSESVGSLNRVFVIERSISEVESREFSCYRHSLDATQEPLRRLVDPFPTPKRDRRTHQRGRFLLPFTL